MLVKDGEMNVRHAGMQEAEQHRQTMFDWIKRELKDSVYVQDDDQSPTNVERQMGKPLSTAEVERKIHKIAPRLRFERHPHNPSKKIMWLPLPNGDHHKLMIYENGIIPEHSIMQKVVKETLRPEVVQSHFHIDRKDLTKHEVRPHEFNEDGSLKRLGEVVWDETEPMVGMQRTEIPWAERVRGYRTMLAILVKAEVITPTQAEREFGGSDRAEWAGHMGKREKTRPW